MLSNVWNAIHPEFSATVNKYIDLYGDWTIVGQVKICRKPLDKYINVTLDVLTLGKFANIRNNTKNGELYHLFMQLKLRNPKNHKHHVYMQIEKNEVITINVQKHEFKSVDSIFFSVPAGKEDMTLKSLITLTENKMGTDNFVKYDAAVNNCQHFVLELTKVLLNYYYPNVQIPKFITDYIYQPLEEALKNVYAVKTIGKKLTDVAGFGKRLLGYGFDLE